MFTCLAGEVQLNGLDADVGGTGGHDCGCEVWEEGARENTGEEGVFTARLSSPWGIKEESAV